MAEQFITKNENSFPILPQHPAIVSASDVQEKRVSARILQKHAKHMLDFARNAKKQRREKREQKQKDIQKEIDIILGYRERLDNKGRPTGETHESSTNKKIEDLHRLLNNQYKNMDQPMIDRIRRELRELHENNPKPKTEEEIRNQVKKEDQQAKHEKKVGKDKNDEPITFASTPPEQTTSVNEEIDNNNDASDIPSEKPLPIEAQIAESAIKVQVKK